MDYVSKWVEEIGTNKYILYAFYPYVLLRFLVVLLYQ